MGIKMMAGSDANASYPIACLDTLKGVKSLTTGASLILNDKLILLRCTHYASAARNSKNKIVPPKKAGAEALLSKDDEYQELAATRSEIE